MDYLKYIILIAGLALLILSAVSLGSVSKYMKDNNQLENQSLKNVKRVSLILLVVSIVLVVMSGWEIFSSYKHHSQGFTYYF